MNLHFEKTRQALALWEKEPAKAPKISGLFECHIFCSPLHPSQEEQDRFVSACESVGIKALCLGLDYQGKGVINVLQSTKYYEGDAVGPTQNMLRDAEALSKHFEIVRLKLEAMSTNQGVPQDDTEAKQIPGDTYFEYHIKIEAPVSAENDERLKMLGKELTEQFGVKVPFSCNNLRGKNQRFLNTRTYHLGVASSAQQVEQLSEEIERRGFVVGKIIREFIVFDTNKDLDRGWLEF